MPEIILIVTYLVASLFPWVLPFWFIFRKAGFAPTLSLLMWIPLVNVVMMFYLAFAEWPILKQQQQAGT